jgi:hypothetical protein
VSLRTLLERSERSERGRKGVDNESGGVLITSGRAPCIIKTTIESPLQCLGKSKGSHAKMPLPSYPKHTVQPKWNQSTIRAWKSIRNYPTLIRKSGTISIRPFTANNLAMRLFYARPLSRRPLSRGYELAHGLLTNRPHRLHFLFSFFFHYCKSCSPNDRRRP